MAKSRDAITALCLEARRRHITYGRLVAGTTPDEREALIEKYMEAKKQQKER